MRLKVLSKSETKEFTCKGGENLLSFLQEQGYVLSARCGGNGKCGKCKVRVIEGRFEGQKDGYVLSCLATIGGDASIEVFETEGGGLTKTLAHGSDTDGEEGFGVALDIGTTTLAFALVELKTGEIKDKFGVLNNQGGYGADVLSRIAAADQGKAKQLQESVLSQTCEALSRFLKEIPDGRIRRLAVCGNTTMLHFFLGRDARGIGQYPFRAQFLETVRLAGAELGLCAEEVLVLPSVAAYFGADAVVGGLAAKVNEGVNLLADIGTNGEMLLHANGKLYATSTAAGPCFEGANIECGTGGVAGAIDSVTERDGKICYTVIGGGKAEGICGAGLVDAVALMVRKGVIDETGAFTGEEQKFYIADGVYVSQADVRNFQLAKSAICAGIRVLLSVAGVSFDRLEKLYVAGGLGFYLDLTNAVTVGLFSSELSQKLTAVGNTALAGTVQCLCSGQCVAEAEKIAREAEYIDLSASPEFMDEYIKNMDFEE